MTRTFVTAAAALLALASSAFAQSPPPMMMGYDWTGAYLGLNVGADFGDFSGAQIMEGGFTTGAGGVFGPSTMPIHRSSDGITGGGQAGYNWEFPSNWLVGVEGDFDGSTLGRRTTVTTAFGSPGGAPLAFVPGDSFRVSSDWNASVRARAGYAWNRFMVYGTAGIGFADATMSTSWVALPGSSATNASQSRILFGPTAGVGFEYAVASNISLGAEYRFADYGSEHFNLGVTNICNVCGAGGAPVNATSAGRTGLETNAILFKVNFHFAPPPPPPAPMPVVAPAPPPPMMARTFLVFFDFDRYFLTPDARRVIEAAAGVYKAGGHARIDVSGYTDLAGTQAYNLRLSQRRADAVAGYLEKQGVPRPAMDVKWFGKEHPRVPTPDGVREPQNRRVEIVMP